MEMMTRQLADAGGHTLQHQVLTALAPWMENLNFRARWEGKSRIRHPAWHILDGQWSNCNMLLCVIPRPDWGAPVSGEVPRLEHTPS